MMASTRNLTATELRGEKYGTDFDDSSSIQNIGEAAISRIVVGHNPYIQSLTVHYTSGGPAVRHGGSGGTQDEVILGPGEFITKVKGSVCTNVIARLNFVTNKGRRLGPFGSTESTESFVWEAANRVPADLVPHMGLLFFCGSADSGHIRYLSATFAKYKGRDQPPRVVKYEKQVRTGPSPQTPATLSNFAKSIMSPIVTIFVGPDSVEFHAYQDTLCRLPFFRAALQGEFREASEKKITMPEDEPEIISALIEFLYTGSYTYTYDPEATTVSETTEDTPVSDLTEGSFHVSVYTVAFKYDCQLLVRAAVASFTHVLKQLNGISVIRLWKAAYAKGLFLSECENDGDLDEFKGGLAKLLKVLYETDREEMESTISEYPALSSDFLRLVVSS